jgi:hypothetical protein
VKSRVMRLRSWDSVIQVVFGESTNEELASKFQCYESAQCVLRYEQKEGSALQYMFRCLHRNITRIPSNGA